MFENLVREVGYIQDQGDMNEFYAMVLIVLLGGAITTEQASKLTEFARARREHFV